MICAANSLIHPLGNSIEMSIPLGIELSTGIASTNEYIYEITTPTSY